MFSPSIVLQSKGGKDSNVRQRPKPSSSSTPYKPSSRHAPHPASTSSAKQPSGPSCSNIWSLICSILLIILMFTIAFLVYEHYTCPEEQDSLIISGWKKAGVLVVQMREMILKEMPANDDVGGNGAKADQKPKKMSKSKTKKNK